MTRQTPGPWEGSLDGHGGIDITGSNGSQVCFVRASRPEDADLIAASPDMLDALREFVKVMDSLPSSDETSLRVWDIYHTAVAAIKKATGETT